LANLSQTGKTVLADVSNAAVTLDNQGNWHYRHSGNNRDLHPKMGQQSDLNCVQTAMSKSPYTFLSGGPTSVGSATLSRALGTVNGRASISNYLRQTRNNNALPPTIKSLVFARVGEAVATLPGETRGAVLESPEFRREYQDALSAAMKLEASRVENIASANATRHPQTVELFTRYALAGREGGSPKVIAHAIWSPAQRDDKKTLYSCEFAPGIKGYMVLSAGVTLEPSHAMNSEEWRQLLRSGKAQAYYGNIESDKVFKIPSASLLEGLNQNTSQ
jgi:hypothetical protein